MLVEKKKPQKTEHLVTMRNKQIVSITKSPKPVTLPKFSWEKDNGRDSLGSEERDQNQVGNKGRAKG